jgi:hypothetical protein
MAMPPTIGHIGKNDAHLEVLVVFPPSARECTIADREGGERYMGRTIGSVTGHVTLLHVHEARKSMCNAISCL